jgi:hypothetical protein
MACLIARDVLADTDVVPLDPSRVTHRREQEVIRQVVQLQRPLVSLHAMDFHTLRVVYISVLGLSRSKQRLVVKIVHVMDLLLQLQLHAHVHSQAVHRRDVSQFATKKEVPVKKTILIQAFMINDAF